MTVVIIQSGSEKNMKQLGHSDQSVDHYIKMQSMAHTFFRERETSEHFIQIHVDKDCIYIPSGCCLSCQIHHLVYATKINQMLLLLPKKKEKHLTMGRSSNTFHSQIIKYGSFINGLKL